MTLYKLTNENMTTRVGYDNETKWELGVPVTARGTGGLCTDGVVHAYKDPRLAVLLNPAHAAFSNPRLFEAAGDVVDEAADKVGVKTLTLVKELELPTFTREQVITFAIRCALKVYQEESFVVWANKWLSGADRSHRAATAAATASVAAAATAAATAAAYSSRAAYPVAASAAYAAYAAGADTACRATYEELLDIIDSLGNAK